MIGSLSKREKRLLSFAALLGVLFIFYRFLFLPQWEDFLLVRAEIENKQDRLYTVEKIYDKVLQLNQENEKKTQDLDRLKAFDPGNHGTILLRLDEIALDKGIEIKLYRPGDAVAGQIASRFVTAKITGTYGMVESFFKELDNLPNLIKINLHLIRPLNLIKEDGRHGDLLNEKVMVEFTLEVFNFPEKIKPEPPRVPKNKPVNKAPANGVSAAPITQAVPATGQNTVNTVYQ